MWWIRYKESKLSFETTHRRKGFKPLVPGSPRPSGCLPRLTVVEREARRIELKRQAVAGERVWLPELVRRCNGCGDCGKYPLPYRDRGRVITALRSSGELIKQGVNFNALELVNINGYTMEDMVTWPIEEGFALRHKTEKWYWSRPNNGRVWYQRPGDVEGAWRKNEAKEAVAEDRNERKSPAQQKFQMVRGSADGLIEVLQLWFP